MKEEIIKRELFNIIDELKRNQGHKNEVGEESLAAITRSLQETAALLAVKDPEEVFLMIKKEYFNAVEAEAILSPGVACIIEDSKERIYLAGYSGDIGDETGTKVTAETRFDYASITKLFTVLEALKLNQDGAFDINQVVKNIQKSPYKTLNVTVADLLRFKYELQTQGRIDDPNIPTAEFYKRLFRPNVGINAHKYSDIPYIVVKTLMPNSRKFFTEYYEELGLLSLGYDLHGLITGSHDFNGVSDPKARLMMKLGIQPGHAGLFGTADDLIKVFDALEAGFLDKDSLDMLVSPGTTEHYSPIIEKDGSISGQRPITRGMGVYIDHPEGLKVGELLPGLSKYAFSITGFTGGFATYDLVNGLSSVVLANPLTIAATQAKVLSKRVTADNPILFDKQGELFPQDTTIVSSYTDGKKMVNIFDPEGNLYETRPYTNITNGMKIFQIHTLLKLRLVKRVAMLLAKSDLLAEHIEEEFNGGKEFLRR